MRCATFVLDDAMLRLMRGDRTLRPRKMHSSRKLRFGRTKA